MKQLRLKTANEDDLLVTHRWASDKEVRKYSLSTRVISFDEHKEWFLNKIKDSLCSYFILQWDDVQVGSIRFDIENKNAIISYLIDTRYQGNGLGKAILEKGIKQLKMERDVKRFTGYVKKENIPSVIIFEKMGFIKKDYSEDILKFELKV